MKTTGSQTIKKIEGSQLKVVVYWGDILYDTLVCNPNESLSVGQAPGNTIVIPSDERFHHNTLELIKVLDGNSAVLNFDNSIEGHVYFGSEFLRLNSIVESGKARSNPDGTYQLKIKSSDKADLVLGHLSFYLEWVKQQQAILRSNVNDKLATFVWSGFMSMTLLLSFLIIGTQEPSPRSSERPERLIKLVVTKPAVTPPILQTKPTQRPGIPVAKLAEKPTKKGAPAPAAKATPQQIQAAELQKKKAQISQSLNFLSKSPITAQAKPGTYTTTTSQKYANVNTSVAGKLSKGSSALNAVPNPAESSGPIVTKGVRSIQTGAIAYSEKGVEGGTGVYVGNVRGKVAVADLYGQGKNEVGGALSAEGGVTLSGEGTLPESLIEKALAKRLDKLQYCYEKSLLSDPTLSGTLKMQWTILSGGKASAVKVVRSQLANKALHDCISAEIAKVPFPSPKGGSVTVTKPFSFSSTSL